MNTNVETLYQWYKKRPCRLTKEEMAVLSARAIEGDVEARNEIVRHNLGLVHRWTRGFFNTFGNYKDMEAACLAALTTAAGTWDATKGVAFKTWATRDINRARRDVLNDSGISMPRDLRRKAGGGRHPPPPKYEITRLAITRASAAPDTLRARARHVDICVSGYRVKS